MVSGTAKNIGNKLQEKQTAGNKNCSEGLTDGTIADNVTKVEATENITTESGNAKPTESGNAKPIETAGNKNCSEGLTDGTIADNVTKVEAIENITTETGNAKPIESGSEPNFVIFNKTHANAQPQPRGTGPNGGRLQSHHGLQKEWAKANLSQYGYDERLAPTITIETGKEVPYPHTIITNAQNARRDARLASGQGKWSTSLQDELSYIVTDLRSAGFSDATIGKVLQQQYNMLDKLKVPYERIKY